MYFKFNGLNNFIVIDNDEDLCNAVSLNIKLYDFGVISHKEFINNNKELWEIFQIAHYDDNNEFIMRGDYNPQ